MTTLGNWIVAAFGINPHFADTVRAVVGWALFAAWLAVATITVMASFSATTRTGAE